LSFQQALFLRTDQGKQESPGLSCSQLGELPAKVYRKLFNSMVAPAFDYGAPVCLIIAQQYAQQT